MTWLAAVDYRQGTSHRRAGIPCQDFGRLIQPDADTVIAAIADGAGSAPHSHVGARIAVDTALAWTERRIAEAPGRRGAVSSLPALDVFRGLTGSVRHALTRTANDNRIPIADLACTLTVVAAAPNGVMAAQIGDGIVVTRLAKGGYSLLTEPDRGEYVNETRFVTDADAEAHLQIEEQEGPVRFVSAATDGLTPVSVDNSSLAPHAPFFQPIDHFARASERAGDIHDGIREFLRSDRLAARTDDDLALMVCGWRGWGQ